MMYRRVLPLLALGFLLAASAWGQHHPAGAKVDYDPVPGGGDPETPEGCTGVEAKVTINDTTMTFSPATVTIDPGQPVCWTWSQTAGHNVRSDDGSFTSGAPAGTGTFQRTYTAPGTYGFHCQVHGTGTGGMRGTVVVRGAASGEGPGKIQLASSTYIMNETAGTMTVTVARLEGSDGAASVQYATANGTAKSGKDFTTRKGTLRWTAGDAEPKVFEVPIKNDTAKEPNETFSIKLTKATGAALGTTSAATVTINDDDSAGGCPAGVSAPSEARALGQSPDEIRLTWADDSGAAKAFRIERRQEGGAFEEIALVPAGEDSFTDSRLPAGTTFQYRIRAMGEDGASAFSSVVAGATDGSTSPCDEKRGALCLNNGRFEATVKWGPSEDETSREVKRVMLPEAPNSGLFSLSPHENLQLLVNVVDGCNVNDRFWLDFAAVTDAELTLKVRDTRTGRTWVYFNPAGTIPESVRDTEFFATCP